MLTCSEARKKHEAADDYYPGKCYFGPWAEPEQHLESTGNNFSGACERCKQEAILFGMVLDRWIGIQICENCINEIKEKLCLKQEDIF
jgi:hypothetical protein